MRELVGGIYRDRNNIKRVVHYLYTHKVLYNNCKNKVLTTSVYIIIVQARLRAAAAGLFVCLFVCLLAFLPTKERILLVFRFIIEYSSFRDFGS